MWVQADIAEHGPERADIAPHPLEADFRPVWAQEVNRGASFLAHFWHGIK